MLGGGVVNGTPLRGGGRLNMGGGTERFTGGNAVVAGIGDFLGFLVGEDAPGGCEDDKLVWTFKLDTDVTVSEEAPVTTDEDATVELGGGTEKFGGKLEVAPGKDGGGLLKFGIPDAGAKASVTTCPNDVADTPVAAGPKCPGCI